VKGTNVRKAAGFFADCFIHTHFQKQSVYYDPFTKEWLCHTAACLVKQEKQVAKIEKSFEKQIAIILLQMLTYTLK
jgi:hypothetical protein